MLTRANKGLEDTSVFDDDARLETESKPHRPSVRLAAKWNQSEWDMLSKDDQHHVYMCHASLPYFLHHVFLTYESEIENETWPEKLPDFMDSAMLTAQAMTEYGHELERVGVIDKKPIQESMCMLLPMGHYKTSMLAVALPLWLIARDPCVTIAIASSTSTIAGERIGRILSHIESNEEYVAVFGDLSPKQAARSRWTTEEAMVDRPRTRASATLKSFGVTSAITGTRYDYAIVDDAVTELNIATPEQREKVHKFITSTLQSRLNAQRRVMIVIGTSYHYGDAYQQIEEKAKLDGSWLFIRKAAILNYSPEIWPPPQPDGSHEKYNQEMVNTLDFSNVEVLWPDYWSAERLYVDWFAGPTTFSTNRQNEPLDEKSKLFPVGEVMDWCFADGGNRNDGERRPKLRRWVEGNGRPQPGSHIWLEYAREGVDLTGAAVYISVDPGGGSIRGRTDLDYTVYELWVMTADYRRILVDMFRIQGFPIQRCKEQYIMWAQSYQPDYILFEAEQHQRVTASDWELASGVPVQKVLMPRGKMAHAESMRDLMTSGMMLLASATPDCRKKLKPFVDELDMFPRGNHDDTVAAAIHFHTHVRPAASGSRSGTARLVVPHTRDVHHEEYKGYPGSASNQIKALSAEVSLMMADLQEAASTMAQQN